MPLRVRTFSRIVRRSSGIPEEGAYRVWLRERASPIAALTGSGESIQGSPPSKRHTFWPAASSSMTRLRTLTISEKPTLSKRRAVGGNAPSLNAAPASDGGPATGPHQEVEDHSDHRQEDDQKSPENLCSGVGAALEDGHDGDDVEHEDDQSEQGVHRDPPYTFSEIAFCCVKRYRYSRPPAFESLPDMLNPPEGCTPTRAPVHLRVR